MSAVNVGFFPGGFGGRGDPDFNLLCRCLRASLRNQFLFQFPPFQNLNPPPFALLNMCMPLRNHGELGVFFSYYTHPCVCVRVCVQALLKRKRKISPVFFLTRPFQISVISAQKCSRFASLRATEEKATTLVSFTTMSLIVYKELFLPKVKIHRSTSFSFQCFRHTCIFSFKKNTKIQLKWLIIIQVLTVSILHLTPERRLKLIWTRGRVTTENTTPVEPGHGEWTRSRSLSAIRHPFPKMSFNVIFMYKIGYKNTL